MDGDITLTRAGAYVLDITVDGSSVINAPHSYLYIQPTTIHASNCVPVDVPSVMYAGFSYSFRV